MNVDHAPGMAFWATHSAAMEWLWDNWWGEAGVVLPRSLESELTKKDQSLLEEVFKAADSEQRNALSSLKKSARASLESLRQVKIKNVTGSANWNFEISIFPRKGEKAIGSIYAGIEALSHNSNQVLYVCLSVKRSAGRENELSKAIVESGIDKIPPESHPKLSKGNFCLFAHDLTETARKGQLPLQEIAMQGARRIQLLRKEVWDLVSS